MTYLELRIHPPIILLLSIALAYLLSTYLPIYALPQLLILAAPYFAITGALIAVIGVWQFRHAQTTIDPKRPDKASHVVCSGIYRFTRNPMYLGMVCVLFAAVFTFADLAGFAALLFFICYIYYFQIKPEERMLEQLFANEYIQYKNKVRRWI